MITDKHIVLAVLKDARERISDPEHWTKGVGARDANGAVIRCQSDEATCWCAIGSISRSELELGAPLGAYGDAISVIYPVLGERQYWGTLSNFNDSHTHEEVLELFDQAIARLEKP